MADTKITALAAITTVDPANDVLPIVDVSDNSMAASGTTKRITSNQILGAGGTATLASATITGDLTVRTNKLAVTSTGVGIGTASPSVRMELSVADAAEGARLTASSAWLRFFPYLDATDKTKIQAVNGTNTALSDLTLEGLGLRFNTNAGLSYAISNASVHTWQNVGGVAGTAMTLNSTGLGVGASPANDKLLSLGSMGILLSGATSDFSFRNSGGTAIQRLRYTDATGALTIGSAVGTAYPVELGGSTSARAVTIDSSSNVISNVTGTAPTLATNSQMVFNLTSNTNLRISVRGSDGVTRTTNLTLA